MDMYDVVRSRCILICVMSRFFWDADSHTTLFCLIFGDGGIFKATLFALKYNLKYVRMYKRDLLLELLSNRYTFSYSQLVDVDGPHACQACQRLIPSLCLWIILIK